MTRKIPRWGRDRLPGGRYGPLFLALLALYVIVPLATGFWTGRAVHALSYAVIVLGVFGGSTDLRFRAGATVLALASFSASSIGEADDVETLSRGADIGGTLLLASSVGVVLMDVLRQTRVTVDTVLGAICAYFMLSGMWAFTFSLTLAFDAGAFEFPAGSEVEFADSLYFSVATQTTLGYGDITPVSSMARGLAGVEALIGQIFLAVLVARLVAVQVATSMSEGDDGRRGDG